MNLVDRYIFKQLLNNSLLILIFIISVFCLAKSVQLIELMISRNLPFLIFFKLIMNSIPQIIPILFPIIISLSIFFVYSRMNNDKELIVLQSSSYSNIDLIKPTFFYSLLIALICSFFSMYGYHYFPMLFMARRCWTLYSRRYFFMSSHIYLILNIVL